MPSIETFRQFLVLAQHLNFTTSADILFITQPALSRHISELEASIGAKLFTRTTHSVSLTPAGVLFQSKLSQIMDDYQDLCTQIRLIGSGYENRLKISCPYYAIHDYLGSIPELFEKEICDTKLQYTFGDPYDAMQHLLNDRSDIAILPFYPGPNAFSLRREEVFVEHLGVLMNQSNPLAASAVISLKDLADSCIFSVGNFYFQASWQHITNLCQKAGIATQTPELFGQMEELIMALGSSKNAIAVVGNHMRTQESEHIAFRPLSDETCIRTVCIWYKPQNTNPAIKPFIDFYTKQRTRIIG